MEHELVHTLIALDKHPNLLGISIHDYKCFSGMRS